ncbi:MAG: aminodeoxychorismate/anthranilate synthase component II [Nitrospira sp.]|nr:aminodeoxychorismate/anthranilate synthase component II [Candidatus Manganitrophaceae bacterium]HIL35410.1 aminodeoxychorismate/anthranilate synthase component II [Candidatus Manganitrophaceae bacterium]
MLLVIDNYDSFTYNLVQYLGEMGEEIAVHRNDQITLEEIDSMRPDKIVISPGPGIPKDAGISIEVVRRFGQDIPILGVCLGHQAIGEAFGGEVIRADRLMHGKTSIISHDGRSIYLGLPVRFPATRYHSLILRRENLPDLFEVTAWTDEGELMGIRHKTAPIEGVQFHPESILTEVGKDLLKNFLKK